MNKSKWISAVGVFVLGASLAVAAPQQDGNTNGKQWGGHGRHHRRGEMGERLANKLNLTDAQKQQVRDLNKTFREDNKAFFQSFHQTMKDFRAAKQAGDTAKADALKATLESQRAQMKSLRDAQAQRFASILTPEQRTQWEQMKANRAAHRGQHQH